MDNDGVEELVINIGDHLLILKFTGKPNQHSYDIFYAKIGEATQPGAIFLPSTIYDLNGDGMKDILLSMDLHPSPKYVLYSGSGYNNIQLQMSTYLNLINLIYLQNYPNPFNPLRKIKVI